MLRGLPLTKLHGVWSGQSTMTSSGTSPVGCPPKPPMLAVAAPPGTIPRTPTGSLLPVHLLHVYAQDKYHGCIRNDMMLMDKE
jgi:hypothetical protein